MKTQVAIVGSFARNSTVQALISVWLLGCEIGRKKLTLVYDALPALGFEVAEVAREFGAKTIAVSPATGMREHEAIVGPLGLDEAVLYSGRKPSECETMVIDSSEIVVFAGGDMSALHLFDYAQEEGKTIGVLVGTGGIADDIETVQTHFIGGNGGVLVHETDPGRLLEMLLALSSEPATYPRAFEARKAIAPHGHLHQIRPALPKGPHNGHARMA